MSDPIDVAAETPGDGLPPLREVIATHGLDARRSLGQNFLFDLNLTGRIARAGGEIDQGTVIEIGPGPGGLTRALLGAGARRVIAIERDSRCRGVLAEIAAVWPGRLETIEGDALDIDVAALGEAPRRVIANLPYNVATPLLIGWLRHASAFERFVLMFQKEVVDRLAARPGTKDYGRLSVITQWLCEVRPLFDVNPRAFTPPPKVVSTVVRIDPRPQPLAPARMETLERVTAAAFGQRRKMLRASLKALGDAEGLCAAAGLDPTARAETIPVEGFAALARAVDAAGSV
ncbi:16S rRNA (adenine(1518)-N(6)/adenine(1519)-N(6))-dimethyltransferase RsmA [Rhodospirillum rubrum]|uniref:Ribosomal RNA small subunit methyltransferase A n=1 Tax=Rhodospirillum rubrum (strain ATCC 11170 / ATH 1.1.1 / DSM 467 / LMG 4362 / NCIMB 8255 / S1) TaxID=269796 RepID=RSMA_RHORT|nr:16S rRNA (adenine(1518)-N(6)/adenine(1519)-N(6))-dimethyltransferase RsmA [Rhodospirillum rubrum]Q2RXA9.1 RecName: Full=Ribosomal RNA small subunit methyltransferase A; AltName: Full=16S rRNA (adenine(1518)-N(6)/adenine(1519)-N(6))-dimethyltransferase; AltName: Full=16S rRNA dimethyladenosine transferase; AltName: Full=16S rRNA dimethylase; AltName: Full=S-adenosylmethionine-6-N', N'-adenosyl(rRNA) dimethyltransferase [Rhodospirillum rubrum ATCC 11170]ABC21236.1 dimethyladenosine transferase [